jgi:hypothetical protein
VSGIGVPILKSVVVAARLQVSVQSVVVSVDLVLKAVSEGPRAEGASSAWVSILHSYSMSLPIAVSIHHRTSVLQQCRSQLISSTCLLSDLIDHSSQCLIAKGISHYLSSHTNSHIREGHLSVKMILNNQRRSTRKHCPCCIMIHTPTFGLKVIAREEASDHLLSRKVNYIVRIASKCVPANRIVKYKS